MKHVVSNSSRMRWWIRQSISHWQQSRIVRLPLNKIGSINKINKMYALLEQSNERPPSAEEMQRTDDRK
jgi:RNA polymerase primary sigma factor